MTQFRYSIIILSLTSIIQAISIDCRNLTIFAQGLRLPSKQPAIWASLQSDCCSASGVACDINQRVISISWTSLNLDGSINGSAIPPLLRTLELYYNQINGTFPNALPSGLTKLDLSTNRITGNIPTTLPSGLLFFHVPANQMTGDVPILPNSITDLALGYPGSPGNHFTGTVRLNSPIKVWINDNWITDIIIQDTSQIQSLSCDLSNNPLLGSSRIASLTMCTKIGLYAISDCSNLIIFARGLGMQSNQPSIWTQLHSYCCTATGVTCISQRVVQISWNSFGLSGFINGSAISSFLLTHLSLSNNQINGSIPVSLPLNLQHLDLSNNLLCNNIPSNLPPSLINFKLYFNQLTGNIPSVLPSGINILQLHNNKLTGSIPILPSALQSLWLQNNLLTGNIQILPISIQELILAFNLLTGSIPTSLPPDLTNLELSFNILTGNAPSIMPNNLQYLGLAGNKLSGDLPSFPTSLQYVALGYPLMSGYNSTNNKFSGTLRLNQPIDLFIYDNSITDIIVQNSSLLTDTTCDISKNPLLGNPHLANLNMCIQLNLTIANVTITPIPSCNVVMPKPHVAYLGNNNDLHVFGQNLGNSSCSPFYKISLTNSISDALTFPLTYTQNTMIFTDLPSPLPSNYALNILNAQGSLNSTIPIINPFLIVNSFANDYVVNTLQKITFNLDLVFQNMQAQDTWSIDSSNSLFSNFNKISGTKSNTTIVLSIPVGNTLNTNLLYSLTTNGTVIPGYIHFNALMKPVLSAVAVRSGTITLVASSYQYSLLLTDVLSSSNANTGIQILNSFILPLNGLINAETDMPIYSKIDTLTLPTNIQLFVSYPSIGSVFIENNQIDTQLPISVNYDANNNMIISATQLVWKYTNTDKKMTINDFRLSLNLTFNLGVSQLQSKTSLVLVCSNAQVPNVFGKKSDNAYQMCDICPIGSSCSNSGLSYPIGLPGYYPTPSTNGEILFTQCIPAAACSGTTTCNLGYNGTQCGDCASEFYHVRVVECTPCNSNSEALMIVMAIVFILVALVFVYIKMKFGAFFIVFGIGLRYMQSYYIYQSLLLQWSGSVQELFDYMSIFSFNIDLTSPECFNPEIDYFYKAKIIMALPILFLLGLLSLSLVRYAPFNYPFVLVGIILSISTVHFKRPSYSIISKNIWFALAAFHILIQLLFVTLCTWIMGYYACVPFGQKIVMVRSPSNECYKGTHLANANLFYVATLFYVIGIPLYFCILFKFKYSKSKRLRFYANTVLNTKDSDFTDRGMLIIPISLIGRVFMVASATFLNDVPVLQAIIVMSCCIVQLSFLLHLEPYKERAHTNIDVCTQAASIVTLNCGVLFYVMLTTQYGDIFNSGLTTTVLAATFTVIFIILVQVFRDFKKAKRKYFVDKETKKEENALKKHITFDNDANNELSRDRYKPTIEKSSVMDANRKLRIRGAALLENKNDFTGTTVYPVEQFDNTRRVKTTQNEDQPIVKRATINHDSEFQIVNTGKGASFISNEVGPTRTRTTVAKETPSLFNSNFEEHDMRSRSSSASSSLSSWGK